MLRIRPLLVVPALVSAACLSGSAQPATPTGPNPVGQGLGGVDVTQLADYPLQSVPSQPVTPRFVLEHRSALNNKTVRVSGTVIRVVDPAAMGGSGSGTTPAPGANPQPRVFLVETPAREGDTFELLVLLEEGDRSYSVGQTVEIEGVVESGPGSVILRRTYSKI